MARIEIDGSCLGTALSALIEADDIQPGHAPSYQLCKIIWTTHPLGDKMVTAPIKMAQSQQREIAIPDSPEQMVRDKFLAQWREDNCDQVILNVMATARAYGIASLAMQILDVAPDAAIEHKKLWKQTVSYKTFDPLNTSGSLVLNQDPNAFDFQLVSGIAVSGVPYHRSRTVTMMNERPVYIDYTTSAFGFVGRSVFQRALFPLKSFVQSMITDDLITKKAGVFIAMIKTAGAIINAAMQKVGMLKRLFVKEATNGNVISIGVDEKIETLNMQNIDGAYGMARKNILENIAVSADMPAKLLNSETFAEGFGEGTEDAKHVAGYIDRVRQEMQPLYGFLDRVTMWRAWNPEFVDLVKAKYPDLRKQTHDGLVMSWMSSFTAGWPSLLTEPDSEKVKTEDVKLKAIIAWVEVACPLSPPEVKAQIIEWAQQNINENKMMFKFPMELDTDAIATYEPVVAGAEDGGKEPSEPKPFSAADSTSRWRKRADEALEASMGDMIARLAAAQSQGKLNGRKSNGTGKHS